MFHVPAHKNTQSPAGQVQVTVTDVEVIELTAPVFDSLGFIMAYEAGEIEYQSEIVEGFQALIDTGLVWQLQGSYGRTAMNLINHGLCVPA